MTGVHAIIHSARLISGGATIPDSWVAFAGASISATGTGTTWRMLATSTTLVTDAHGRILAAGFVDIHCHGGGGRSFDDGAEAIAAALRVHRRHGTTRSVLSLVTADQADLERRVAVVADLARHDALILGAHLEGPFLDQTYRGAHDPNLLSAPDARRIERLLTQAQGQLRQITLAPELPGALEAIAQLVDAGVVVAVGHSAADYATTLAAFDAGATILTHAFNGMKGIHHRAPGPVAAAMHRAGVTLEIINDGVHVHPEVVRLAFAGAPGRIALVTDAMAATGASDGAYLLGSLAVTVSDGVARLRDGGSIAGSTLTLDVALRRAVTEAGVPIVDAIAALTETPARAIGRGHDLGLLNVGYAADAVLLSADLEVEAVFAAGRPLVE